MSEIDTALELCLEQNLAALERGDFPPIGPDHKSVFWVEDGSEIRLVTAMSAQGRSRLADSTLKSTFHVIFSQNNQYRSIDKQLVNE